ncbi:hypothetical protein PR003_g25430 [Phytophthora rubi]|uniref:Uncharacterized protein n=1 Tax=Phytophthora rubi TaxID=129364 RepID=A0A6A3NCS6_9STRA|nr:hypothetical protein PR001_g6622 [Phytophthora rubi]KAE9289898.1 hypothetical protein PR003_g25430 [Phytophthora rubi]
MMSTGSTLSVFLRTRSISSKFFSVSLTSAKSSFTVDDGNTIRLEVSRDMTCADCGKTTSEHI